MGTVCKEDLKAQIANSGEWSEAFLAMLSRLADSFDEAVPVSELSTIIHPIRFSVNTFLSVNNILKTRGLPVKLEIVEDKPRLAWFELKAKMTHRTGEED